jgi:hypothetical protein
MSIAEGAEDSQRILLSFDKFYIFIETPQMINFLLKGKFLFIILTILLLIKYFMPEKNSSIQPSSYELAFKKARPHYAASLPDSLPWNTYIRMEDSIQHAFYQDNRGKGSFQILNFGITEIDENYKMNYVVFQGYQFDDEMNTIYFKKNGNSYFTYAEYEKSKGKGYSVFTSVTKQTQMEIDQKDEGGKIGLLFPISKSVYIVLFVVFCLFALCMLVFFLHVCFYLPLRILYNISKGESFTDENIGSLYTIGRILLFTGIFVGLAKIITHFAIRHKLPNLISFNYYEALMSGWVLIVLGIIVLIIARAFLEGSELKDEQALTV